MPRKPVKPAEATEDDKTFRVSQSKVKTYRRCRAAYHYRYVDKLRSKRKPRALTFGTIIHNMIERHAEGDDPMEVLNEFKPEDLKLFAAEKAEYGEIIEDAGRIMKEYFAYWDSQDEQLRYVRIKGKSAEHSFDIEILPDVIFNGKIDAIGKQKGLRWLVEHKSFKRRPNDDDRWRNLQSVTYFNAMDILGWPSVDGTCWDYVWSKAPGKPGLLKDGTMSRKSIDTLPSAVEAAIAEYGFKTHDYRDFVRATEKNRSQWFTRIFTTVNQEVKDFVYSEFVETVKEMVDNHGKKKDMNIERHCSWCDYEPLCRARLQGLDYEFIKERQYEKSTGRGDEEADHTHTLEE